MLLSRVTYLIYTTQQLKIKDFEIQFDDPRIQTHNLSMNSPERCLNIGQGSFNTKVAALYSKLELSIS